MPDLRAALSRAQFETIPVDPDYPLLELATKLLYENGIYLRWAEQQGSRYLYPEALEALTGGQRILLSVNRFDMEVCNGGITQFFWNCPELVFAVRDALDDLRERELLGLYERAVESLAGNQQSWEELRQQCFSNEDHPDWEPFRQSYDLLDLGWFEDAYFSKQSSAKDGSPVVEREGLQTPFLQRVAEYVKNNPDEFICG